MRKKRKGFTLLEVVVATVIFALAFGVLLSTAGLTSKIANYGARDVANIVKARTLIEYMQQEFASAQRMQYGSVSDPTKVTSVAFKKYFSLDPSRNGKPTWVQYSIEEQTNSNGQVIKGILKRNGIPIVQASLPVKGYTFNGNKTIVQSGSNLYLTPIDKSHYFYSDFWTPSNILVASNHNTTIKKMSGLNDYMTDFWKWRLVFQLNGYPMIFFAERQISPVFDPPTPAVFNSNNTDVEYNIPADTSKAGQWSNDFVNTNDLDPTEVSSYDGVKGSYYTFFRLENTTTVRGYLEYYDGQSIKPMKNAVVSCYSIANGTVDNATTDDNGFFMMTTSPGGDYILYYAGSIDGTYAEAIKYVPSGS